MPKKMLLAAFCLVMCSCTDKNTVFLKYENLNNGAWAATDTLKFELPKFNPGDNHNLFFNVRNDEGYAFSNLFVITYLNCPDGQMLIDTLEYEMAKPSGEWLGTGMGSIKESKLWYKENLQFKDTGRYLLKVRQAMRKNGSVEGIETLGGITDFGLEIQVKR